MGSRSIRTACIALACALHAASGHAQDEGLRLKVERQLHMAVPKPERDSAKFIEADHIEGEQDKNIVATGNVTLRQRGAVIRADRVDYSGETQTAVATGNVRIDRQSDIATGPRLVYHTDSETGEMESPVFEFPKKEERKVASRGLAQRALLEEDQKSRLFTAEYTSCPVPRDDWFIRVRELEIDGSRNIGNAYNSTVYFLGVPILYSPFISFPLDNRRKSGFLTPTFGTSGKSGFDASIAYYWNIAENMDATFTPKVFTKRGFLLGSEYRYLEKTFNGELDGEYLPHDRIAQRDRYFFGVHHAQQLGNGFSAGVNAVGVSDDDYFRDLSTKIALTSQTTLPREASLAYNSAHWATSARVLAYQTLQDPNGIPIPIPYKILPQILVTGNQGNYNGFDLSFQGEGSNFRHPTQVNGERFIAYPSISYPIRSNWGYVVPKIGYHYTRYRLDTENNPFGYRDETRGLPIASLDAGAYLDRDFDWRERSFQQTLEPRLFYLNVPFKDQSNLPNFTTAESDFNFQQIFYENRFVGGDRIGDANQLTLALASRLIDSATGIERFRTAIGQVYYFRPPKVTLTGVLPQSKSSDILFFAGSEMSPSVSVDAGWQYTPNLSRSEKITLGAHYAPKPGSILNAAFRYARGVEGSTDPSQAGIEQVDLSTQWPVLRNVTALGRWNWSTKDRKLVEGLAGFEYNAGCWQVRAVAHRFITTTNTYSTSFQIQLELSGLSRIGINPLETIRQNISGYRRSDEIPPE